MIKVTRGTDIDLIHSVHHPCSMTGNRRFQPRSQSHLRSFGGTFVLCILWHIAGRCSLILILGTGKHGMDHRDAPDCPDCQIPAKWFRSELLRDRSKWIIANLFVCANCERTQRTDTDFTACRPAPATRIVRLFAGRLEQCRMALFARPLAFALAEVRRLAGRLRQPSPP